MSKQTRLGKRKGYTVTNDKMIQHPHINISQGFLQPCGDGSVGTAGLADPGRMIVGQDQRPRIVLEYPLEHLAGIHRSPVNGAGEQAFKGDHPMLRVEEVRSPVGTGVVPVGQWLAR